MNNFKFSFLATLNVSFAVALAVLAFYGASSLTPIPQSEKSPRVAGQATEALSETGSARLLSQASKLKALALDGKYQIVEENDDFTLLTQLLPGQQPDSQEVLSLSNPNPAGINAYISAKVPESIRSNVTVDLLTPSGAIVQLWAPGMQTLPVSKIEIPSNSTYVLSVRLAPLQQINFVESVAILVDVQY